MKPLPEATANKILILLLFLGSIPFPYFLSVAIVTLFFLQKIVPSISVSILDIIQSLVDIFLMLKTN